jgi:putative addiction module killer protein
MSVHHRTVLVYTEQNGKQPFVDWLNDLRDLRARAEIRARLARLETGNLGGCKSVGGGVQELRIRSGPGYRVYFAVHGNVLVLLLGGGTKRTQRRDIEIAKQRWLEGKERL